MNEKTSFGFQQIPIHEKTQRVTEVFNSVASKYDLMNDLMSFGMHRLWKKFTIAKTHIRKGHIVLDAAAGTGDLSSAFAERAGKEGLVVCSDINANMLAAGRDKLIDQGKIQNIIFVQADAEQLPFSDNFFDRIVIAFGLRNITHKDAALQSMHRTLKPGGKLLILEFSKPILPLLNTLYDSYSFHIIPKLGEWIVKDRESYQYLVESIRMHPDQKTLSQLMQTCGFEDVTYHNLSGGIVALHCGMKY